MARLERVLDTGVAPEVWIEVAGDLTVAGWDEAMVMARAAGDTAPEVQAEGTGVTVRCAGDCTVQVPRAARVRLAARGDAKVTDVAGGVMATEVNGDLALRRVGPVEVGRVAGDLAARGVAGDLGVGSVAGDASVAELAGALRAEAVAADLSIRSVAGEVVAACGADAALVLDLPPRAPWRLRAGADIACRVRPGTAACFELVSGTGDVQVRLPGAVVTRDDAGMRRVEVGSGGPMVRLQAGADVALSMDGPAGPGEVDMAALGVDMSRLAEDIERNMAGLADRIAQSMRGAGLSEAEAERVAERVRQAQDRAVRHARHHVERAQRRAERHGRHGRGPARGWAWAWGGAPARAQAAGRGPQAARAAAPAATEAERAAVLRMLSEKRISSEEAGRLLDALEGR